MDAEEKQMGSVQIHQSRGLSLLRSSLLFIVCNGMCNSNQITSSHFSDYTVNRNVHVSIGLLCELELCLFVWSQVAATFEPAGFQLRAADPARTLLVLKTKADWLLCDSWVTGVLGCSNPTGGHPQTRYPCTLPSIIHDRYVYV